MEQKETDDTRGGIQVIARAASILRALETHSAGMSLGEIAKIVDLPRSTVQRIVDALGAEGLVVSSGSGVRLGPAILALAASTKFEIADLIRDDLQQLCTDTGETVDLSIYDGDKVVFIDHLPGSHRLRAVSAIGVSFPLHCCAPGKAVLAALGQQDLDRLRRKLKLAQMTEHTITDWDDLDKEIDSVRREGIAYDREEHSVGICAVATTIVSPLGQLLSISMPIPTPRFKNKEQDFKALLLEKTAVVRQKMRRL
ncbi:hypothetical protein AYR66_07065 [Noviherbaspirillum denitrificans]|uniref:IclR family transcriptional regulator n=2 Tax=Noviherbaspirillum denitrificans TaxID=1968433 RepID=A0A254T9H1_9BURK|nr:hypothetical protein AYR66_07065 [Noviherbaspirillum denitrificans]